MAVSTSPWFWGLLGALGGLTAEREAPTIRGQFTPKCWRDGGGSSLRSRHRESVTAKTLMLDLEIELFLLTPSRTSEEDERAQA
jgi:hypothetical protein